jgi:hypothetical protein
MDPATTENHTELVEDVWIKIFSYLPKKNLLPLATVCPRFNDIIFTNQRFYKKFVLILDATNPQVFDNLVKSNRLYSDVRILNVKDDNVLGVIAILDYLKDSLRKVEVINFKLSINNLYAVISKFPLVQKLRFENGQLLMGSEQGLEKLTLVNLDLFIIKCVTFNDENRFLQVKMSELVHLQPKLKCLVLESLDLKFFFTYHVDSQMKLRTLSLTSNYLPDEYILSFYNFLDSQTELQKFFLTSSRAFCDVMIMRKILTLTVTNLELTLHLRGFTIGKLEGEDLTSLCITKLHIRSDWGVKSLFECLPNLVELDVWCLDSNNDEISKMKNLKKLTCRSQYKIMQINNSSVEEINTRLKPFGFLYSHHLFTNNPNLKRLRIDFNYEENEDTLEKRKARFHENEFLMGYLRLLKNKNLSHQMSDDYKHIILTRC